MQFRFNKDMILKQRFWVMLCAALGLTLSGIFYLELFVNADDAVTGLNKSIQSVKNIKGKLPNPAAIKARTDDAARAQESESKIWSAAFDAQKDVYKWSDEVEKKFDFYNGRFATDIKLIKGSDPKSWPKDTDTLVHGNWASQDESWIKLKTRDGKEVIIYATPNVMNNNVIAVPDGGKIRFADVAQRGAEMSQKGKEGHIAVTFQRGRYFNDLLTEPERIVFADSYKDQIPEILKIVDPLDEKNNGVVQLRDWLYKPDALPEETAKFINFVRVRWNAGKDFSKGAWIAQENLWIQKEIYRIIRETNDSVSHFEKKAGSDKNGPHTFQNSYFKLELTLLKDSSLQFKITNRLPRKQRLDLSFRVKMNDGKGFVPEPPIKISGDPLSPAGDKSGKDSLVITSPAPKDSARKGIYEVDQLLTWETAAVKRIDQIAIGSNGADDMAHSQRTFADGLRPFLEADIGAPNEGDPIVPVGKAFGPAGGRPPPGKARPNFGGAAGANIGILDHGLWRDRYIGVDGISEQSRRIPVGVVLIIDQEHVDRVLTHFNNSKLRFLETQVLLNHYPGSLQPPPPPDAKSDNTRSGFPGYGPGSRNPAQPAASGGGQDLETNMEIVIYGIMTLYERYPPRPNMPVIEKK